MKITFQFGNKVPGGLIIESLPTKTTIKVIVESSPSSKILFSTIKTTKMKRRVAASVVLKPGQTTNLCIECARHLSNNEAGGGTGGCENTDGAMMRRLGQIEKKSSELAELTANANVTPIRAQPEPIVNEKSSKSSSLKAFGISFANIFKLTVRTKCLFPKSCINK